MKKRYFWDNDRDYQNGCFMLFDTQYFFKRLAQRREMNDEDRQDLWSDAITGIADNSSYRTGSRGEKIHGSSQAAIEYFPKLFPPKYHNQIKQELCYAALKGDKTARKILQAWEGEK